MKLTKAQKKVANAVYLTVECSNGVFDFCKLHHKQRAIAEELESLGLLEHQDDVVTVDEDGFVDIPEKYGRGYRLTPAGIAEIGDAT